MGVKTYSVKSDGNKYLSANFKVSEFRCNDGSDKVLISDELVTLIQKIRNHFSRAVTINSAYRTESYNKKIGGATRSQHILGTAADITISGVAPLAVAQYAEFLQPQSGGIGVYTTFTHVDVRSSRSRWDNRSGKEVVVSGWPGYVEKEEVKLDNTSKIDQDAVNWMVENRIMQGDKNGSYKLSSSLTRDEFSAMLYRYHLKFGQK